MEDNPVEAVRNNSLATRLVARISGEFAVDTFVLVSTDKAVKPKTVMGASKALAEWAVEAEAVRWPATCFSTVRFGNVLGSSGSVVPIFRRQIAAGGPVTVTDQRMTRYFMTIPEAVQLIIRAGSLRQASGEVFVLEMGDPVRIVDLAETMIRLSGFEPGRDIAVEFVGARSGEKFHEELFNTYERPQPTPVQKIVRAAHAPVDPEWVARTFAEINLLVLEGDAAALAGHVTRLSSARSRAGRRFRRPLRSVDWVVTLSSTHLTFMISFALSLHSLKSSLGTDAGFVAILGLAILTLLYFAQARETRTVREALERSEAQLAAVGQRLEAVARAQAAAAQRAAANAPAPIPQPRPNLPARPMGSAVAAARVGAGVAALSAVAAARTASADLSDSGVAATRAGRCGRPGAQFGHETDPDRSCPRRREWRRRTPCRCPLRWRLRHRCRDPLPVSEPLPVAATAAAAASASALPPDATVIGGLPPVPAGTNGAAVNVPDVATARAAETAAVAGAAAAVGATGARGRGTPDRSRRRGRRRGRAPSSASGTPPSRRSATRGRSGSGRQRSLAARLAPWAIGLVAVGVGRRRAADPHRWERAHDADDDQAGLADPDWRATPARRVLTGMAALPSFDPHSVTVAVLNGTQLQRAGGHDGDQAPRRRLPRRYRSGRRHERGDAGADVDARRLYLRPSHLTPCTSPRRSVSNSASVGPIDTINLQIACPPSSPSAGRRGRRDRAGPRQRADEHDLRWPGTCWSFLSGAASPAERGVTHVLDRGLSLAGIDGLVEVTGGAIDIVKLGWGTAVVTENLEAKVERYQQHGIPVVFGGTLTELAIAQDRLEQLLELIRSLGLRHVEISDGTITLATRCEARSDPTARRGVRRSSPRSVPRTIRRSWLHIAGSS